MEKENYIGKEEYFVSDIIEMRPDEVNCLFRDNGSVTIGDIIRVARKHFESKYNVPPIEVEVSAGHENTIIVTLYLKEGFEGAVIVKRF